MKRLSIVVPVFNERTTVEESLRRVSAAPTPGYDKEVVVVDDGSTDGSGELLVRLASGGTFVLERHLKNRGKGAAIRTGLARVTGEAVLIQDADLEYDPADYAKLLAAFEAGSPVVYGSRYLGRNKVGYTILLWGNNFLTALINLLFGARLTDVNTCYKLFRTEIIKGLGLVSDGFDIEMELTGKTLRAGHKIVEIAIAYDPRRYAAGMKIRIRDGVRDLLAILRFRFSR